MIGGSHTLSMELIDYRIGIHEYEGWLAYNGVGEGSITIPMVLLCLF